MRVLDLCTEFASETAAFKDRGHEVITLGIEGDVDIKCDIRQYFPSKDDKYDVIFFHPPCPEFSIANYRLGACKDRHPDMSIVWAGQRIINTLNPKYWIMENPRGCMRYFVGKPQYTINYGDFGHYSQKPTDIWGIIPFFQSSQIDKVVHNNTAYNRCGDPKKRALLPYGLSLALCKAIERDMGIGCVCLRDEI